MNGRTAATWLLPLTVLLVFAVALSATLGFLDVSIPDVFAILWAKLAGHTMPPAVDPVAATVVADVRMPRILASVLVGGLLGVSGAVFQAILLNPLADSYTLGISTGAAFGASLVIVLQIFGLALPPGVTIPVFAFGGGVGTLAVVLFLAAGDRRLSSTSLILAGVIVAAILSAAIGFLKFLADEQVGLIIFWLMGSLAGASWQNILLLAPTALLGTLVGVFYSRDLNIMATGDRAATSLGINTVRLRTLLLTVATLMTALAVSVSGIIGFVGLIVPHMLRHLVGPDNRLLIPLSFFTGGLLLLIADTLTRAVLPVEVPIGVLTALLGGPFFCILFKRRQQDGKSDF
ncbi:transport system permease protein [Desulfobulbus propionicus DSM 2032]|uniref:Transport system permease protein n=1 Tax=Desulfobulbus propionicus (strain ATCC 33891 / DSM 2032 / VKM B-1956 / 1pr3) TaxID=577650 RepID=A0A7U3YPG9_DESPD|nr:iron ABC transporter permease [Desulfobulbus propionicus]ADW19161.1 transport system permease protein [Desulfobulbus propionicus DSM 2032]